MIKISKIQCKHCNDIIESKYTHHFVTCKCGKVSLDGGKDYQRMLFPEIPLEDHIINLSEYEEESNTKESSKRD